MPSQRETLVVLDATVLSNFAYIDEMDFLASTFENPATVRRVAQELRTGVDGGYTFLTRALDALPENSESAVRSRDEQAGPRIKVALLMTESVENTLGDHGIDSGEAHALAHAVTNSRHINAAASHQYANSQENWGYDGVVFASDDQDARREARDRDVAVIGTVGILARGVDRGAFSLEQADAWLDALVEDTGYYSPVESIAEVLPDDAE